MASGTSKRTLEIITRVRDKTKAAWEKLKKSSKGAAGKVVRSWKKVRKTFLNVKSAIVAVTAALAAAAIGKAFRSITGAVDDIAKSARRLNLTVETLSALKFAGELSGVAFEKLRGGLRFFSKQVSDAANGVAGARSNFEELGVEVVDVHGKLRPVVDILADVGEGLNLLEKNAYRSAIAQRIFGEETSAVQTIVEGGIKGLREMMREARRYGAVITTEGAKKAEAFNDALLRLQTSISGVVRAVVLALSEKLTPAFNRFARFVSKNRGVIVDFFIAFGNAAVATGNAIITAFREIFETFSSVLNLLKRDPHKELAKLNSELALMEKRSRAMNRGQWHTFVSRSPEKIAKVKKRIKELQDQIRRTEAFDRAAASLGDVEEKIKGIAEKVNGLRESGGLKGFIGPPSAPGFSGPSDFSSLFPTTGPSDSQRIEEIKRRQELAQAKRQMEKLTDSLKKSGVANFFSKIKSDAIAAWGAATRRGQEFVVWLQEKFKDLKKDPKGLQAAIRDIIPETRESFDAVRQYGGEAIQSLQSGLTNFFDSVISGAASIKDAFKALAKSIVSDLIHIFSKALTNNILAGLLGGVTGGGGGGSVLSAGGGAGFNLGGTVGGGGFPLGGSVQGGPRGGVNVNFNISAMDGRDVKRVLIENMGTIEQGIRRAIATKPAFRRDLKI